MCGRLCRACGVTEYGRVHLRPDYVRGEPDASVRMAPLTQQSVTHRQLVAPAMPTEARLE